MKLPFVSVIIPTYNRAAVVHRAIDSVLRQSYPEFELIVVDDGSTDETSFWKSYFHDDRLKWIEANHKGVAHARNVGAQAARGEWLSFLDSDDVWRKHKLTEQIRFHTNFPEIQISQTEDIWIRDSKRVNKMKKHAVREGLIFKESLELCLVCCSSVMIHKDLFFEVGGFDETLPTCEDYDLWLKILCQHPIGFVNKILVSKFGGHADQLSKAFEAMDRYRCQALENLLLSDRLTEEQRAWVQESLERKRSILETGSLKRQTHETKSKPQTATNS